MRLNLFIMWHKVGCRRPVHPVIQFHKAHILCMHIRPENPARYQEQSPLSSTCSQEARSLFVTVVIPAGKIHLPDVGSDGSWPSLVASSNVLQALRFPGRPSLRVMLVGKQVPLLVGKLVRKPSDDVARTDRKQQDGGYRNVSHCARKQLPYQPSFINHGPERGNACKTYRKTRRTCSDCRPTLCQGMEGPQRNKNNSVRLQKQ